MVRNCFARKKDIRPPTRKMQIVFREIKLLAEGNRLRTFPEMPLRSHKYPVYPAEILSAFYFWSMMYPLCAVTIPVITDDTKRTHVQRRVEIFVQYCKGKFTIDETLFSETNMDAFKWQYLDYVAQRKPVPGN